MTLDGELEMHNYEARTVDIVIHNPVPGRPLAASDGGTLQTDPTKLQLVEREGVVSWRLKLEPGEHKTLTYPYEGSSVSGCRLLCPVDGTTACAYYIGVACT